MFSTLSLHPPSTFAYKMMCSLQVAGAAAQREQYGQWNPQNTPRLLYTKDRKGVENKQRMQRNRPTERRIGSGRDEIRVYNRIVLYWDKSARNYFKGEKETCLHIRRMSSSLH